VTAADKAAAAIKVFFIGTLPLYRPISVSVPQSF